MKTCSKCKIDLPLGDFYFYKTLNRPQPHCKECQKNISKQWIKNNPSKNQQSVKQYKQNNPAKHQQIIKNNINKIPPGVYMLTCLINNKKYIGESERPQRRKYEHFTLTLNKNNYSNPNLQDDIKLYGKDNFKFEMLEICSNHVEREKFWIDKLKPEYNIK